MRKDKEVQRKTKEAMMLGLRKGDMHVKGVNGMLTADRSE